MKKPRRKFSVEDKLSIVQESLREGIVETCRKYNLANSMLNRWKREYEKNGSEGLKPKYHRVDPELRALENENEQLKKLIGRMALELEVKTALLKKTPIQNKKK